MPSRLRFGPLRTKTVSGIAALPVAAAVGRFLYGPELGGKGKRMNDGTITLMVNGEHRRVRVGMTIAALAVELGLDPAKVAVERNLEVVPRSTLGDVVVADGDELEIVHFVGGGDHAAPVDEDSWTVAGRSFRSRLIVGTGKYKDFAEN